MKKYLMHRLRSTMFLTITLCILAVILVELSVSMWVGSFYEWMEEAKEPIQYRRLQIEGFEIIMFILGAMCTAIPIVELGDIKSKRNADLIYSLPVSRIKMALAHYLSGLIQIFAVYTVSYVTMYIKIITSPLYSWVQSPSALIGGYFALLGAGVAIYSIFMAVFNVANTMIDGCVFIAVWAFLVSAFVIAIGKFNVETSDIFKLNFISYLPAEYFYPHAALFISDVFYSLIVGIKPYYHYANYTIAWGVVGIICAAVYFVTFTKKRTEELEGPSDTLFGYRVILPISVFSMTQALDDAIISFVFAILIGVVGYMIYRRSFKIKKQDIITISAICAFTGLSMILFS